MGFDLGDLKRLLVDKGLPTLAEAVMGPKGKVVTSLLGNLFGKDPSDINQLASILNDPASIVRIRELEAQMAKAELDHDLAVRQVEIADRESARGREIQITSVTGKRDLNMYAMAWLSVIGFFAVIMTLMYVPVPTGGRDMLLILLGILGAIVKDVYGFFFGSSQGSKDKTELLAQASK